MVILFKSQTGSSGQMLICAYGQLMINFIEVAIKENKEKWIACKTLARPFISLRGGVNDISTGLCT